MTATVELTKEINAKEINAKEITAMEAKKNLQKRIEEAIRTMELLRNDNPNGWIVESENHVCVGKEDGLNGTTFTVKNAVANTKAIIYDTKEDAEKYGFDYYLIDGRGNPIYMKATKAVDFYQREIDKANEFLMFINSQPYNKL